MPQPHDLGKDPVAAARAVTHALREVLGDELFAVYLHGSAVLGGFRWDRSDLDVLAVSRTALSDDQVRLLADALGGLSYPDNGLEFTLMTAQEAAAPETAAPRFQLHTTTAGRDRHGRVVDGRTRSGDRDLVLHLAVCRERGLALFGPPATVVMAQIPSRILLLAMRDEIRWAADNAPLEYLVLTSARAWLFAETHRMASKIEAGEWAAARYDDAVVIEAALRRQRGADAKMASDAANRLAAQVDGVIARLSEPGSAP